VNIDYDGISSVIDESINRALANLIETFTEEFGDPPVTHWEICPNCHGDGSHSKRLGVVDPDDWEPEEFDEYLAGRYDATCERCNGTGKIKELDEERLTPEQREWVQTYEDDIYESYAIQRQEMMFGA
jgi:DnaJ-class molecular chaperone